MYTGFASENTPAVQVWDSYTTWANNTVSRTAYLADDCAPIQIFRTGATANGNYNVYLPTSPIEGKVIKIVNARFGTSNQYLYIYSSDASGFGASSELMRLGAGQTLELCFIKNAARGNNPSATTGWFSINQSALSSNSFNSVALGGRGPMASGSNSCVVGGELDTASGALSSVVGGQSNTASGTQAAVVGGNTNTASAINCVVVGGSSNTANVNSSACLGGAQNTASGTYAAVVGSFGSTTNAEASSLVGGGYGTTRSVVANHVRPGYAPIATTPVGVSQIASLILGVQTTDGTGTTIRSNQSAAGTTNQLILPNNSAFIFQGTLVANVTGGGNSKAWKFEGLVKRGANAASTALVAGVSPTVIAQNTGAAAWTMSVSADTSNGGVQIMVFGAAATTIRWVAKIETTEVTF